MKKSQLDRAIDLLNEEREALIQSMADKVAIIDLAIEKLRLQRKPAKAKKPLVAVPDAKQAG